MLKRFLFIILILALKWNSALCQSQANEYSLKAAFVYNFTKYINWGTYLPGNEFIIGILGSSLIYEPLQEIARTKTVNNKKIVIVRFDNPDEIGFCNILYIPRSITVPLYSITTKLSRGTLTITEEQGYAHQGSAFNFVLVNDKLRFESNRKAIDIAGLKASSQLLKLAIIVD